MHAFTVRFIAPTTRRGFGWKLQGLIYLVSH